MGSGSEAAGGALLGGPEMGSGSKAAGELCQVDQTRGRVIGVFESLSAVAELPEHPLEDSLL